MPPDARAVTEALPVTSRRQRVRVLAAGSMCALPMVMVIAATAKLTDWPLFEASLASYTLLPAWTISAAVAIPAVEFVPMTLWICGAFRFANRLALALLLAFTALVAWHYAHGVQPVCACFGQWSAYFEARDLQSSILWRNGALIALGLVAELLAWRWPGPAPTATLARQTPAPGLPAPPSPAAEHA